MLEKLCELCGEVIPYPKAQYAQTKYCDECAKKMHRLKSLESFTLEDHRIYNQSYRKTHARSTRSAKKSGPKTKRKPVLSA